MSSNNKKSTIAVPKGKPQQTAAPAKPKEEYYEDDADQDYYDEDVEYGGYLETLVGDDKGKDIFVLSLSGSFLFS